MPRRSESLKTPSRPPSPVRVSPTSW